MARLTTIEDKTRFEVDCIACLLNESLCPVRMVHDLFETAQQGNEELRSCLNVLVREASQSEKLTGANRRPLQEIKFIGCQLKKLLEGKINENDYNNSDVMSDINNWMQPVSKQQGRGQPDGHAQTR